MDYELLPIEMAQLKDLGLDPFIHSFDDEELTKLTASAGCPAPLHTLLARRRSGPALGGGARPALTG
ncbi:MAG TPA: hypothetical protein VFF69_03650 [Phycisphaerales bacterium]|nr:hypothetical protein [Phycisphaerales bacterium]